MNFAVIGRETNLAQAELETLASRFIHLDNNISLFVPIQQQFDINRAGGVIKFGQVVDTINYNRMIDKAALADMIVTQCGPSDRKITFGISSYLPSNRFSQTDLYRFSKTIKSQLSASSIASRFVKPANGQHLSAAEIIYNHLIGSRGHEWVLFCDHNKIYLGKTLAVQDINSYSLRDRGRPVRNAKIGMLPPKLAQIMLNLAKPKPSDMVVDPFCGSGVICAEAMLANHNTIGADISKSMVAASRQNLSWLTDTFALKTTFQIDQADATQTLNIPSASVLVSETYLGPALSAPLKPPRLNVLKRQIGQTILDFLQLLTTQSKPGYRAVISLPFWHVDGNKGHLDILDQIRKMGYTIEQFSTSSAEELLYRRSDQIVGRQVLVLIRS